MSKNDEFDLRDLIGDETSADVPMPTINDVPASELTVTSVISEERIDARVAAASKPGYMESGHAVTPLSHPMPTPIGEVAQPPIPISDIVKDADLLPIADKVLTEKQEDLDAEYHATFNATVVAVQDLEPERLQELRHRLYRMIRRAKIQLQGIRVTEEGKLSLIPEKRRAAIKAKDTEFMSRRKAVDSEAGTKEKKPRASKSDSGLSQVEKQVKQFVKLGMSEDTIRTTLASIGTSIPENLAEMVAKARK